MAGATNSPLEKILNNPGLAHIAENIFGNLDDGKLKFCGQINQSSKQILANPIFWLKKFKALSEKNHNDWVNLIRSEKNTERGKAICSYLQWNLKKDALVDLECYSSIAVQISELRRKFEFLDEISELKSRKCSLSDDNNMEIVQTLAPLVENPTPNIQDDFRKKILQISRKFFISDKDIKIVKILTPLIDKTNDRSKWRNTSIYQAVLNGNTNFVKIMAPLTDNANGAGEDNRTPIYWAARLGYTEIVRILATLTANPNAPDNYRETPIYWAARNGHFEIVKILAPLTGSPNARNNWGQSPINVAANYGHTEIVKILAPLTDYPNDPDAYGWTPILAAAYNGHTGIVKILAPFIDNLNAPNRNGDTPIGVAKNEEIRRFLKSFKKSEKIQCGGCIIL